MAMPIHKLIPDPGPRYFYQADWQLMFETHIPIFLNEQSYRVNMIDDATAYKYDGDFFGLMYEMNVAPRYHWTIMRLNGLQSTFDYDYSQTRILVPDEDLLGMYNERFRNTLKKIK